MNTNTATITETTVIPTGTRVQHKTSGAIGTVTNSWMGYGNVAGAQVKWDDKARKSSVLARLLTAVEQ